MARINFSECFQNSWRYKYIPNATDLHELKTGIYYIGNDNKEAPIIYKDQKADTIVSINDGRIGIQFAFSSEDKMGIVVYRPLAQIADNIPDWNTLPSS